MPKHLNQSPDSFLPLTPVAFEILLALADGERHGYDVMIEIERRTGGGISPNPGTLYPSARPAPAGRVVDGGRPLRGG